MATLEVYFQGWFQCRLATDPDPFDEPRGVSGWTFAVAGEPDLDRVIRFQDPVALREFVGLQPDVRVTGVMGVPPGPPHPLVGGKVQLLEQPRFEGRNGLIADDGRELIAPFHLGVSAPGNVAPLTLRRRDPLDPGNQDVVHASSDARKRREGRPPPRQLGTMPGVLLKEFDQVYKERRQDLERQLAQETDGARRVALDTRIWAFDELLATYRFMSKAWVQWSFNLGEHGGQGTVNDPGGLLRGTVDTKAPWPLTLNMGAWDADALCGFAIGILKLPFTPST